MKQTKEEEIQIHNCFPASKKVYVQGSREDLLVPMREIELSPTVTDQGKYSNEPFRVYDTSGKYTEVGYEVDIRKGLPSIKRDWIWERNDVEEYEGREVKPQDNGFRSLEQMKNDEQFPLLKLKPLRSKKGRNVTQMHYA